jgi:hypothetical protein
MEAIQKWIIKNLYTMQLFNRMKLLNIFTKEPKDILLKFCML